MSLTAPNPPLSTSDVEANHDRKPLINQLPGEPVPYYMADGEGQRYERDGVLWTVIARNQDTGGAFEAAYLLGAFGTTPTAGALADHRRTYYVMSGAVRVSLNGTTRLLVQGDSVHVPSGESVALRFEAHLSKLLLTCSPAGALDLLLDEHPDTENRLYSAGFSSTALSHDAETPRLLDADHRDLPTGNDPYFLAGQHGDTVAWPDAVNTYLARGRNTAGQYIQVNTLAAPQPYIIRHFHHQHTENFICASGRIWLWINGEEVLLTEGDFVHAPAGTVHSFAIAAHNTKMLGLLTTDIFEPFFDVTGTPTDDTVYTEGLIDPSTIPAAMQAHPELDVTVVGPPPERVRAPGM